MSYQNHDKLSIELKGNLQLILKEQLRLAEELDYDQVVPLIGQINAAKRIFVVGSGRSGLSLRAAAMRLMHLGLTVYVVGETTTPAIVQGDLLIAASGSGTTGSIVSAARKASAAGADVVAFSTTRVSPLADLCSLVLIIPAAQKQDHGATLSLQYAGSLFEQGLLLLTDAIFQTMWGIDQTPAEELWKRHANLE